MMGPIYCIASKRSKAYRMSFLSLPSLSFFSFHANNISTHNLPVAANTMKQSHPTEKPNQDLGKINPKSHTNQPSIPQMIKQHHENFRDPLTPSMPYKYPKDFLEGIMIGLLQILLHETYKLMCNQLSKHISKIHYLVIEVHQSYT